MNAQALKLAFPHVHAIHTATGDIVLIAGSIPVSAGPPPQLSAPEIYQDGDDLVMMTYDLRTEKFVVQIDDDPEIEVVIE